MRWKAHKRDITSLALTPDTKFIISADVDGYVYQWNIATGELIRIIRQPTGSGLGGKLAYNPSGSKLGVSWTYSLSEGQLEVYDTEDWTLEYMVQSQEVFDFAWSPDGEQLAVASGGIRIINARNGAIVPTPHLGHESWTHCVAYTPDGEKLVSGGDFYDPSLTLWDINSFQKIATVYGSEDEIVNLYTPFEVLHIRNDEVIVNDFGKAIKWNFDAGTVQEVLKFPPLNREHTMVNMNTDGNVAAYAVILGYVDIPNWLEPSIYNSERWARPKKATGATVKVENLVNGQTLHNFEGYADKVTSLIFSPDSTKLFTGDWDGYICVWEL